MPRYVVNQALYLNRTVQDWHRFHLPDYASAMDVDLMGYCPHCYAPLYLIEASTNPQKAIGVLRALGELAHVPAGLVVHDCHEPLHAHALRQRLLTYRLRHYEQHHPWCHDLIQRLRSDLA
jgi:hypothetical protein